MSRYFVNEIFATIQGEGIRAGTPNVFVRFARCNLACRAKSEGFDCDTEFVSGRWVGLDSLRAEICSAGPGWDWIVLTGGEPALQVDDALVGALHEDGWRLAIETNGTHPLPTGLDWVCVSPKTAEHTLQILVADEVKYVRAPGQAIPHPAVKADYYLLSPAWDADGLDRAALAWCIELVKEHPTWRLSVQQHKWWNVR